MMRPALLIAGAAFACCCAAAPSEAQTFGNAPWCAVTDRGTGEVVWDCQFRTVEECVPNVLGGNRGFCNVNPYYVAPTTSPAPRARSRRS